MPGVDKGHLVAMFREIGKDGRDGLAAFSHPLELEGTLHEPTDGSAEKARELVKALQRLAVPFFERGLVVPRVHLAGASVDEDPDHGFGGGPEVGLPGGKGIEGFLTGRPEQPLAVEEAHEPEAAKSHSAASQQGSPVQCSPVIPGFCHGSLLT